MKTETKSKIKKALKVGAYVGGLLLALVLGMGFGSCSEKKMQDQTSQKAEPKKLSPRLSLEASANLLNSAEIVPEALVWAGGCVSYGQTDIYILPQNLMPENGVFVITYDGVMSSPYWGFIQNCRAISNAVYNRLLQRNWGSFDGSLARPLTLVTSDLTSPFAFRVPSGTYGYVGDSGDNGTLISRIAFSLPRSATGLYMVNSDYYLNNADGVDISFSDNWLPYGLFTNRSSGNLGIVTNSFGNAQDTQNTLLRASFSDLLFTCGDGFGYDSVRVTARPLWNGSKYVNENGEILTYSFSTDNEFIPIVINYVDYRRFDTQNWVRVADYSLVISEDGSNIAIKPLLSWASPLYKSPRFFRYPSGFVYPNWEISSDIGANWTYWNRGNPPSGLEFFDWFSFVPEDIHISLMDNYGGMFTLVQQGFSAIMPILSIQILPFVSLGMLIFAPIVVLLILAILKVLNK